MCFILEWHEVVKASLVVACPSVFLFFYDRGRHAELLALRKNDLFLVFLVLWFVSSEFWAGPATDHTVFDKNQDSVFRNFVPNTFSFSWDRRQQGRVHKLKKNGKF